MAESNTDNSGVPVNKPKSVQERIEANARARKTLRDRIGKAINNQSLDNTSQPAVTSQQLPSSNSNPKKKARTRNIFTKMFSGRGKSPSRLKTGNSATQPKSHKKYLIAIIIVATVLILGGLVAGVVIVSNTGNEQSSSDTSTDSDADTSGKPSTCPDGDGDGDGETSSDETVIENLPTVIEDMVAEAESLPQQEAVEYLNTKLQEYTGTTAEFGTRMTLIFQYLRMGDSAAALAVAEAIDTEKLDNEQRLDYFNAMAKISYAEGDSATGEWYQIQYGSLYESIYGENNEH